MSPRGMAAPRGADDSDSSRSSVEPVKDTLDFIIIGAQKAGTTSLFRYLKGHPEVSMPLEKEVPFFCSDIAYERGFDGYIQRLKGEMIADPARKWGTATPHYMSG